MSRSDSNPDGQLPTPLPYAGGDRLEVDAEHLNLLSIFYYIVGGLVVIMSCMFIAFVVMGMDMLDRAGPNGQRGWFLVAAGGLGMIGGLVLALLLMLTGWYVAGRRHRIFTQVMATICLLIFPFGTVLGIATFSVLSRDSIRLSYGRKSIGR
jgi:hypothetical protein